MQQFSLVNGLSSKNTFLPGGSLLGNVQKDGERSDFEGFIAEALKTDDNSENISKDLSTSLLVLIQNILNFLNTDEKLNSKIDLEGISASKDVDVQLETVISEIRNATNGDQLLKKLVTLSDLIENRITKPEIVSSEDFLGKKEFPDEILFSLKRLISQVEMSGKGEMLSINDFTASEEVLEGIENILNSIGVKNNRLSENNLKENEQGGISKGVGFQSIVKDIEATSSELTESFDMDSFFKDVSDFDKGNKNSNGRFYTEDVAGVDTIKNTKTFFNNNVGEQSSWEVNKTDSLEKLVKLIEFVKHGDSKTLTVKLEPDFLGKMNIHLTENAGKISAKIFVEHDNVKNFLLNNAESIRHQLADKGIHIDNMDFMFMGDHKEQDEYRQARSMFGTKSNLNIEKEIGESKSSVDNGIYA